MFRLYVPFHFKLTASKCEETNKNKPIHRTHAHTRYDRPGDIQNCMHRPYAMTLYDNIPETARNQQKPNTFFGKMALRKKKKSKLLTCNNQTNRIRAAISDTKMGFVSPEKKRFIDSKCICRLFSTIISSDVYLHLVCCCVGF